tara:strand:+ start:374 stop:1939 length:1566 start_codon:yes stop_codon:yes gene_type:complete
MNYDYKETAEQLYTKLEGGRDNYLDRGRQSAKLTLPYILTEEGFGSSSRLNTPFQGIGARGVNNLASKLLLALLPPNAPFFRLQVDTNKLQQEGAPEEVISEIDSALRKVEDSVMDEIAKERYRIAVHEALKQLIITGNALLYMPEDGGMRVFRLDRFVIERDPMGNVLYIATKETISYAALDEEIKEVISQPENSTQGSDDTVNLFTAICRHDNKWLIKQDINGTLLPDNGGTLPLDKSPYIPLRFSRIDGEAYGRGYVEEYLGDLQSLEALTQAIVEGSAAAAKVLFLVNPNGTTRAKTLSDSTNGAIVQGNAADVSTLQVNKFNDFRVAAETINTIRDRLGQSFLLTSGAIRNAERVTAEEIRMISMELESALGGLYSLLSNEMQLPLVNRLMGVMQKKKNMPKLPKDLVNPVIVTGIEALGRGHDLQKLDAFLAGAAQVVGPEAVAAFVNIDEYFKRRATSLGIKTAGLIKTQEEILQEQQQQQMQQMAEKLGPAGIKAASDQSSLAQEGQGEEPVE